MQVYKTSNYFIDKNGNETRVMEGETFSPIGRATMSCDITDTFAEEDDSNGNAKSKGKGKSLDKAKPKRSPKDQEYMVILGDVMVRGEIIGLRS
jgi:hypothetical protein